MPLTAKMIRAQLNILKPLLGSCSLKTIRKGQNKIGELMEARCRDQVMVKRHDFARFQAAWVMPKDERRQGVILYLHGGGYTSGDLEYALGFGSQLCAQSGARVFCAAYRLAPEAPFPAAVEDAVDVFDRLGGQGFLSILRLAEAVIEALDGVRGEGVQTDRTDAGGNVGLYGGPRGTYGCRFHAAQIFVCPDIQPLPDGHFTGGRICASIDGGGGLFEFFGNFFLGNL